jgi:hypothetical protein
VLWAVVKWDQATQDQATQDQAMAVVVKKNSLVLISAINKK